MSGEGLALGPMREMICNELNQALVAIDGNCTHLWIGMTELGANGAVRDPEFCGRVAEVLR